VRITVVDGRSTRELRRSVLRPTWPVGSTMHGDDDPTAVHVAAVDDDGTVVGCCLVLPRPYPVRPDERDAWQLRGMATAPQQRGQGVGGLVLGGALVEILQRHGRLVWCDARTSAMGFYRQHAFLPDEDEFIHPESGIPHFRMWRDLSGAGGAL
jgi:predicted GNAT family N-acyltransferase